MNFPNSLELIFPDDESDLKHPLMMVPASCGLPDSTEEQTEYIDLDSFVKGSPATYYLRVRGDSMIELGIFNNDLLVVDRERQAETNDVVVAEIEGGYTVKLFKKREAKLYLVPANGKYPIQQIHPTDEFAVWGVVTHVLHKFR